MDLSSKTGQLLQILSNIAVLVGLVFVGLELRHSTAATSAQALLDLNVASNELSRWHYENETIGTFEYNNDDPLKMSTKDLSAVRLLIQLELNIAENAYMFYEKGILDRESMESYVSARCPWISTNPVGSYLWERGDFGLFPQVANFMEGYCR